jgi:hypothetical protein
MKSRSSNFKKSNNILYTLLLLFIICGFIVFLIIMQVEEFNLKHDPMLKKLRKKIEPLFKGDNYYTGLLSPLNKRDILNEITLYRGDKSYTINKQKVFLCLKDENDEYYDMNMLIYVLLHEISHVICDEVGHTEKFAKIFEELLEKAEEMQVYNPDIPIITDYCQF